MPRVDVRSAVLGAGAGVLGYLVLFVVVVPNLTVVLPTLEPVVVALGVIALQVMMLVGLGALVAALRRRRLGSTARAAGVGTAVAAGSVGLTLVLLLGSAAAAATGSVGISVGVVVTSVALWLGCPALGALLVPAREVSGYGRAAVPETRVRSAARGDAGAATLEGLGVMTIAATLVCALILVMTPAGPWLRDNVKSALCQIATLGKGPCDGPISVSAESHKPTDPCTLESKNDVRQAAVSVMFIAVKGGGTIRVEELSDGTFRVSSEGSGGAGVTAGVGGGVSLTINDNIYGGEAQAQAAAFVDGTAGVTWTVDAKEKDKLVNYLKDERNWATVQAGASSLPVVGPIAGGATWAGKNVWNWLTHNDYKPPAATELYGAVGISGDANASIAAGLAGGQGSASLAAAVGSRVNVETGETTLYYTATLDASRSASIGYAPVHGASAQQEGTGKVLVAVTVNRDGNPVKVSAQGMAVGNQSAMISAAFEGTLANPSGSGGALYNASVELTGPESTKIALDLLNATGIAHNPLNNQVASAYDAFTTFSAAVRERGILTKQDVTSNSNTSFGLQAGGEIGPVGLDGEFSNSTNSVTSGAASYFDGTGWRPWSECTR